MGLALSGWVSPAGAQGRVELCGEDIFREDGIYRLRGHRTCSDNTILLIEQAGAEFDLRGFKATGNGENTGILIKANYVTIIGGTFKNCDTALYVNKFNYCEIEKFKAINSSGDAIKMRGDDNVIVKSLCLKAGNDCFQLRGNRNTAEWCTAIKHGTKGSGQGIQFRGPGDAYKCSVINGGGEGFQIQEDVSDVSIERCLAIKNAKGGIEIKVGATGNFIEHNIAFANGDGIDFLDLIDENGDCDDNTWKRNKFRSSNPLCIK